jgi:hypothetical protein
MEVCNEDDGDSEGSLAESSVNAAARELKREKQGISRCEACHESKIYLDIIELSCGHGYCRLCLQGLFQFLTTVESFLTTELKEKIEEKKAESSNSGRAYCSRMTCSVFIRAKYITGDTAKPVSPINLLCIKGTVPKILRCMRYWILRVNRDDRDASHADVWWN